MKKLFLLPIIIILLAGCESNMSIVNNLSQRDANEIIVFLASKGIAAQKIAATTSAVAGGDTSSKYDIYVDKDHSVEAMAILNKNGLPRIQGTNLLTLFAGGGLMTTDKEETIRYQAGLEEEFENTIRKVDGVLDADVKISFPTSTETVTVGASTAQRIKASVYVKHQGILDDPNQHLENKIKRLLSSSVDGLAFEDVSVISDRSRFTDFNLQADSTLIGPKALEQEYVSIWSIVMTKSSARKFRMIFFFLIFLILAFGGFFGWMTYKFYPRISKEMKKSKSKE